MCTSEITLKDICTVRKATGEQSIWDDGQNIAARALFTVREPIIQGAEDLRLDWHRKVTAKVDFDPTVLFNGIQLLDWVGLWEKPIGEGWAEGTLQVMRGSTKETFDDDDLQVVNKQEQVEWGPDNNASDAERWISTRGGALITGLTESTQQAVEDVIFKGLDANKAPRQIAKDVEAIIGLSPRDAGAVMNRAALLQKQEKTASQINKTIKAYRKKLVSARGDMVARTEMMAARNQGTLNAWRTEQEQGLVPTTAQKIWIMNRGCPICQEIVALGPVPLDGLFYSPATGAYHEAPPAHPRCRCSMGLV